MQPQYGKSPAQSGCERADTKARILRFSDAVNMLAAGMWGGLPQPTPVREFKRTAKKASIVFGPWRRQAGQHLSDAAIRGKLPVYVVAKPNIRSQESSLNATLPEIVPAIVLKRLIRARGSIPDHPIRPSTKTTNGDEKLLALLIRGILVIRESDFNAWYRSERTSGKWASQRFKSKKVGRPRKQTELLRNAVLGQVRDDAWSGKASITKLHRLLISSGRTDVPTPSTLARLVDQLFRETGERELLRIPRARPKSA